MEFSHKQIPTWVIAELGVNRDTGRPDDVLMAQYLSKFALGTTTSPSFGDMDLESYSFWRQQQNRGNCKIYKVLEYTSFVFSEGRR